MAKLLLAPFDNKGRHHPTAEAATIADLEELLGTMSNGYGVILAKRPDLERIFAEHDVMTAGTEVASLDARRRVR